MKPATLEARALPVPYDTLRFSWHLKAGPWLTQAENETERKLAGTVLRRFRDICD